jgi:hypothetical protein
MICQYLIIVFVFPFWPFSFLLVVCLQPMITYPVHVEYPTYKNMTIFIPDQVVQLYRLTGLMKVLLPLP